MRNGQSCGECLIVYGNLGSKVGKVSFVEETIYKASIGIIMASLSNVCGISGYICEVIGGCVCAPKFI